MRLEAVAAALLVLPVILAEPRWWPIDTAIGQILVYLCNRSVFAFSMVALHRAREAKLSSVPETDAAVTGVSALREWVPTSLFYAGVVTVIGSLLYLHKLHDEWVYALSVGSINFFVFYIIKCGKGATEVRVLLTRAAFAGERLRRMTERRRPPDHSTAPPGASGDRERLAVRA
jgi:hypothetical protein